MTAITTTSVPSEAQIQPRPQWLPMKPATIPATSSRRRPMYIRPIPAPDASNSAACRARSRSSRSWNAVIIETPCAATKAKAPRTWRRTIQPYMARWYEGCRAHLSAYSPRAGGRGRMVRPRRDGAARIEQDRESRLPGLRPVTRGRSTHTGDRRLRFGATAAVGRKEETVATAQLSTPATIEATYRNLSTAELYEH